MSVIYLDNNATTSVAPEVFESMIPFFTEKYGNASSMHTFGGQVGKSIQDAREKVAAMLGAQPEEIVFTSCGTESDSTAVMSALQAQPEKKHVITTRVEHSALIALGQHLEQKGYELTYLGVDSKGRLDLDELSDAMRKDTAIVSIMFANNETGTVFPIQKIAEMVDFLALSGHKLHAPKGIGVLYVRKGTRFIPFLRGGHQERGRRAGTENAPYIVGLGAACELAMNHMTDENTRVPALRDKLEKGLLAAIPDAIVNGDVENRLPNTSNIAFQYVEGEAILLLMDQLGICASSGSACTSGSLEPSHVLRAMGVPFTFAHGSIRFSLSRYTTDTEIDYVLENLPPIIEQLRAISPFRAMK